MEEGRSRRKMGDTRLRAKVVPPSATGHTEGDRPGVGTMRNLQRLREQAPEIRIWNLGAGSGPELEVVRIEVVTEIMGADQSEQKVKGGAMHPLPSSILHGNWRYHKTMILF